MRGRIILGPAPCQGCRRWVVWVNGAWRNYLPGTSTKDRERRYSVAHDCPALSPAERRKALALHRRLAA